MNTLTNPQALVVVRDQNDSVAYEPPLPLTTVTVRWAAATCTEMPPSVVVHAAHATVGAVVAGLGETVGLVMDGAGVGVDTTAAGGATSSGGTKSGARLPELGTLNDDSVTATGAAPAHPDISRVVATPTTPQTRATSVLVNS